MSLAKRINDLQVERGVTASDIAEHLEVNDAIVSRIKKYNRIDSPHIPKIATFLGTTTEHLAGGEYIPYRRPKRTTRPDVTRKIDSLIESGRLSPKQQNLLLSFATELAKVD